MSWEDILKNWDYTGDFGRDGIRKEPGHEYYACKEGKYKSFDMSQFKVGPVYYSANIPALVEYIVPKLKEMYGDDFLEGQRATWYYTDEWEEDGEKRKEKHELIFGEVILPAQEIIPVVRRTRHRDTVFKTKRLQSDLGLLRDNA